MWTIGFIIGSIVSAFSIWSYIESKKEAKKGTDEGIERLEWEKVEMPGMIFTVFTTVFCFVKMTGLWEWIIKLLSQTQ